MSQHISADINSVVTRLQLLASQLPLQRGELSSDKTAALLKVANDDINKLTLTDGIIVLDKDGVIVNTSEGRSSTLIGLDRSRTEYVLETTKTHLPYISSGYISPNGKNYVAVMPAELDSEYSCCSIEGRNKWITVIQNANKIAN